MGRIHTFVASEHHSYGVDIEQIKDDATSDDYLRYRATAVLPPDGEIVEAVADSLEEAVDTLRSRLVQQGRL